MGYVIVWGAKWDKSHAQSSNNFFFNYTVILFINRRSYNVYSYAEKKNALAWVEWLLLTSHVQTDKCKISIMILTVEWPIYSLNYLQTSTKQGKNYLPE